MSKRIKELLVDELKSRIGDRTEMLVIDSSRLDAISDNRFRLALREKGITVLTVKNSMARRALHANDLTSLDPILTGPSSLVWGDDDIVSLSKELAGWSKDFGDRFEVKGGTLEGTTLSAADVAELAKGLSRLELVGYIAGLLLAPAANLLAALLGPGATLAGQMQTVGEGDGGTQEESASEDAADGASEETADVETEAGSDPGEKTDEETDEETGESDA